MDGTWLILQRLDDLRRGQDSLRADMTWLRDEMRGEVARLRDEINSVRTWSLGLLLLAILGLLAKLLFPAL